MTRNQSLLLMAIGFGLAAAHASGAQAASTSKEFAKCSSGSRSATINCCEQVIRSGNKPYWMGDKTCGQAVSCSGGGGGSGLVAKLMVARSTSATSLSGLPQNGSRARKERPQRGRSVN